LLDKLTVAPLLGAGPFNVTVPVAPTPPMTLVGLIPTLEIARLWIVSGADFEDPFTRALIFAVVLEEIEVVVTAADPDDTPAAIDTDAGTTAAALSLRSVTTSPPAGAGPVRNTVAVEEAPQTTVEGERLTDEGTDVLTVNKAVFELVL